MENKLKKYRKWYEDGIISYETYCQKCQEFFDEEIIKRTKEAFKRFKKR